MALSEQTIRDIERALTKISAKFPKESETPPLTDLYLQVKQESGELLAFDDDDRELNRCVVEEWIDNKDENFYKEAEEIIRTVLEKHASEVDNLGILKPYSFVLIDEDKETIAELRLVDDDTIIIGDNLMKDLEEDLNKFLDHLLKE